MFGPSLAPPVSHGNEIDEHSKSTGCPLPKVCMPRSVPSTVDPSVDCWIGCDPMCGPDMELCDMGMNEQGKSLNQCAYGVA